MTIFNTRKHFPLLTKRLQCVMFVIKREDKRETWMEIMELVYYAKRNSSDLSDY